MNGEASRLQSVTVIHNGSKSICLIGYLGLMGVLSGFNKTGIFAALINSSVGTFYQSSGRYSVMFSLRYALENFNNRDVVVSYITNGDRPFSYCHNIFLSDPDGSRVVENDMTAAGKRLVRGPGTPLRTNVQAWPSELSNSLAAVNSFVLPGDSDNHYRWPYNTKRWTTIINLLGNHSNSAVTPEDMKTIMTFYSGMNPGDPGTTGDLYWWIPTGYGYGGGEGTQQSILFLPDTLTLEAYFTPRGGNLNNAPEFKVIPVQF